MARVGWAWLGRVRLGWTRHGPAGHGWVGKTVLLLLARGVIIQHVSTRNVGMKPGEGGCPYQSPLPPPIREVDLDIEKPARWFRLYAEFATDPKVQTLSETDQRRFIMLLCLRCSNGNKRITDKAAAFQLRTAPSRYKTTKRRLQAAGLIDKFNAPVHWAARQFNSDVSTERVREHRKRFSNVPETAAKRSRNVLETETEIEIETEKEGENARAHAPSQRERANRDVVAEALRLASKHEPDAKPSRDVLGRSKRSHAR